MSQPNPSYVDGYTSAERRTTVIPDIDYPFENYPIPDVLARVLTQRYDVQPRFFVPKIGVRTSWTNYLLYAETFANAAWTKTNVTNTDAQRANPNDGLVTMASGLETVTNGEHAYQQAITFAAVATTLSWVVTPNGRTWFRLKGNDGTTNFTAFFNLTGNGTVGTIANCTATVTYLGDGTYRISITFTPLAAAGNVYLNFATDGGTVSYAGTTTLGAYVWGAGVVRASTAGPVIITTTVARAVSAPNLDDGDPFAYLVQERPPQNYVSAVAGVERKFARIPAPQTSYPGSDYFALPSPSNNTAGASSLGVIFFGTNAVAGTGFYNSESASVYIESTQSIYGPTKDPSAWVLGKATAGTFTLTFGANTTGALAWNADGPTTIAAAVNALASVVAAGLVCTAINDLGNAGLAQLDIVWTTGRTATPVTMNGAGLTQATANHCSTIVNTDFTNQFLLLANELTITGHGFNTALKLAAVSETGIYVFDSAEWGSDTANSIWVPTLISIGFLHVGPFNSAYVQGGTYLMRTREIETFYLPGVTPGISSVADITSPLGLQNPSDFITAFLTASGFQTYKSKGPSPWMGTLIHSVKEVQINFDDI